MGGSELLTNKSSISISSMGSLIISAYLGLKYASGRVMRPCESSSHDPDERLFAFLTIFRKSSCISEFT
jgi:hypothetical protein